MPTPHWSEQDCRSRLTAVPAGQEPHRNPECVAAKQCTSTHVHTQRMTTHVQHTHTNLHIRRQSEWVRVREPHLSCLQHIVGPLGQTWRGTQAADLDESSGGMKGEPLRQVSAHYYPQAPKHSDLPANDKTSDPWLKAHAHEQSFPHLIQLCHNVSIHENNVE